jgi:hypothetical protein
MNNFAKKTVGFALAALMVGGLGWSAAPVGAVWSQIWNDIAQPALQVFVHQEIHDIIPDVAKRIAMERWQKFVMNTVAKKGGYIWNYGQYLYGSGNSAAAQYWRAFLQNCANINPTVSLNVQFTAVQQKNYDWCPVKINVRGVNIQEKIDLSKNFGWSDFSEAMANSTYRQYLQASSNVEKARQDTQTVKFLEAISSGNKPATETVDNSPVAGTTGPPSPSDIAERERVKIPVQSFTDMLSAATNGVVQVTANQKSIVASAVTYMVLNQATDFALDKFGGQYGDYFQ